VHSVHAEIEVKRPMRQSTTRRIHLYDGVARDWFALDLVVGHLKHWLPWTDIHVQDDLIRCGLAQSPSDAREEQTRSVAERLCKIRILNPSCPVRPRRPFKPEVEYEDRILSGLSRAKCGVLYDGNDLQRLVFTLLPPGRRGPSEINIWFTERLFATWDENDQRYHIRASIYGQPSIVSTAGMVEGPARDRSYYIARRMGIDIDAGTASSASDCLRYEDSKTAEIAKGYAIRPNNYRRITMLGERRTSCLRSRAVISWFTFRCFWGISSP